MNKTIPTLLLTALAGLLGAACEIHEATAPQPSASGAPTAAPTTPAPTTPTPTTPAPTTPVPTTTPSTPPPGPASLTGEWGSHACGDRKYTRLISFDDKAGFSASDLVSPCPKGVTCVWSGIVVRKGSWSSDGKKVTLTLSGPADTRGAAFPGSLDLTPAPAERDAQGAACVYQRADKAKP